MAAGGRAVIRQRLLERESELAEIALALEAASAGGGRLVVVEAPAGLGKSALLVGALEEAGERGLCALGGRGTELEREFPFGVVRQLLEARLAAAEEPERERLFSGAAALAKPLFGGASAGTAEGSDPTYATLHGLYWVLSNLAASGPLALSIDDAHWADAPSLRFLAFLLQRLEGLPVALFVALRTGEPAAEQPPLATLTAAPEALAVRPQPLSQRAVAELVGAVLEAEPAAEFAAACHAATAGNPFYLRAILRELSVRGIEPTEASAERVRALGPRAVSRTVLMRLAALAPEAPLIARAVAVLGDGAALSEAALLAGVEEVRAGAVADQLVRGSIFKHGGRLEFVHPIVREAVYADLAPQERASEHARAARMLADLGGAGEQVAAQLLGAAPAGDEWVVSQLREAARSALGQGASEVAVRYLRRALEEPPATAAHAEVLLELGRAGARAGELDALERLSDALDLAGEERIHAAAAFELGRALFYFSRPTEACAVIDRELARLDPASEELRLELEALLLTHVHGNVPARRLVLPRLQRASAHIERAAGGRPDVLATLAMERALNTGQAADAVRLATRAFEEGGLLNEQWAESPAVYLGIAALRIADRGDLAERYLDRAVQDARRRGSGRTFAMASANRGWTRHRRGNLTGAEADLRAFLALAPEAGADLLYPFSVGSLVQVLLARGDRESAATTLAELDPARSDPESTPSQELRLAAGQLHLLEGRPHAALEEALAMSSWEKAMEARHDAWPRWRTLAALAYAAMGEAERAATLASEAVALAREYGAHDHLGTALQVAAAVGEPDRAIGLLEEAVSELERSRARLDHASALIDLGATLRRANRRSAARQPLAEGLDVARQCGAAPLAERAFAELEATGARPRGLAVSGAAALTPSERRVARMAADGLSNPEIAQALFVSLKTVETHLGHAYQKLDIHSRSELPDALTSDT